VKDLKLKKVRVNNAGCLNRCALGPMLVIYPQGTWYHYETEADIDEIIESHLLNDIVVERLQR
jgi:(2Fe-2S) ferredoxin